MVEFSPPRGMRDIDVDEMEKRMWVESKIEPLIRLYGFKRVEPTYIEHLETLEAKSGSAILDEIYHFKDKAGRDLGLRFDLTVGIARMVANNFDYPEPIKLYAISPMWRYDEPQAGRYRCFWQWDAESFGSNEAFADAEMVALSLSLMQAVGLTDVTVKISHRMLLEGIIRSLGAKSSEQVMAVFRALDKANKVTEEGLRGLIKNTGFTEEQANSLLRITNVKGSFDEVRETTQIVADEWTKNPLKDLEVLWEELGSLGIRNSCSVDMSIVRGLGYYDGIVFEGFEAGGVNLSLFGGGRYNTLTSVYGKRTLPATGVAGGVERLMLALERKGVFSTMRVPDKVFVATASEDMRARALAISVQLRQCGIVAEYPLKKWSLSRQLEYADTAGFTHVLVIGKKESETGRYLLKELKSGVQTESTLTEVLDRLKPP
jgi:histidyl-tRNA synthetase